MASQASRFAPAPPATRTVAPTVVAALAALCLVSLVPAASAQGHEHGAADAGVSIAHDAPPNGRTFVGNVNHFSVIRHGDDSIPDFHQDIPWRVTLNGLTLVETTALSGHDYDGVNTFDIVFPVPGAYAVEALDAEGKVAASFQGIVEPAPALTPTLSLSGIGEAIAGQPVRFTYAVHDPAAPDPDQPIAHSDCTFEALRDGRVEVRAKTHTHDAAQTVEYAFAEAGTYTVRVLCYQAFSSPRATLFLPVVSETEVLVLPGLPANAGIGLPGSPLPPSQLNAVVTAPAGEGMTLVGTFDPYTVVGPDTLQHLNVLAVDATGQTIQHVDFTATLDGPLGRVFQSETLHEYDGILEFTVRQATPGPYTLRVTAEGASGTGELAMTYLVAPRAVPLNLGLVEVTLDASGATTGVPAEWVLAAGATSGPFAHGELEVRLTAVGQAVPFLQAKLHTHATGLFPFTVALPTEEAYALEVTPFPLMAELVLPAATSFTIQPGPGTPLPEAMDASVEGASQDAPALPTAALFMVLGALAFAVRRRR